jgi:uncharacterized FlaG/YvyC family protein
MGQPFTTYYINIVEDGSNEMIVPKPPKEILNGMVIINVAEWLLFRACGYEIR